MTFPKVFVSHAHEDKPRAEELAVALRAQSVDAWLDKWEIQPGDSLIQRIFESGIRDCKVFLVLLSNSSVGSQWVREELDAAMIRRLEGATRVVPVILEPCDVPIALRALLWIDLQSGTTEAAKRIADVAFNRREAPPIAPLPSDLNVSIPGLTPIAAKVATYLSGSLDSATGRRQAFDGTHLAGRLSLTPEDVNDAVEELESNGLVEVRHYRGTRPYNFGFVEPTYALGLQLRGTSTLQYDPENDIRLVAAAVAAKKEIDGHGLARVTALSPSRINNAVAYLEDYGVVEVVRYLGTSPFEFGEVTATAATRRFVAENTK